MTKQSLGTMNPAGLDNLCANTIRMLSADAVQQAGSGHPGAPMGMAPMAIADRPSLIIVPTTIAYGSPNKAGSASAHGEPLGEEEVRATKAALGWPPEPAFHVPEPVLAHFRRALVEGPRLQDEWESRFDGYARAFPEEAAVWKRRMAGELPEGWDTDLPVFQPADGPLATRAASGKTLNSLFQRVEGLVGGSADPGTSNQTYPHHLRRGAGAAAGSLRPVRGAIGHPGAAADRHRVRGGAGHGRPEAAGRFGRSGQGRSSPPDTSGPFGWSLSVRGAYGHGAPATVPG